MSIDEVGRLVTHLRKLCGRVVSTLALGNHTSLSLVDNVVADVENKDTDETKTDEHDFDSVAEFELWGVLGSVDLRRNGSTEVSKTNLHSHRHASFVSS